MPLVHNTVTHPIDGSPAALIPVTITLVAATLGPAPGYEVVGRTVQGYSKVETDAAGLWSADLVTNDDLSPASTYYEVEERAPGQPVIRHAIAVPDAPTTTLTGSHTLPVATVTVASAASFATSGWASVGGQLVKYTGKSSTTLTGCTGGTGVIAGGATVEQAYWAGDILTDPPDTIPTPALTTHIDDPEAHGGLGGGGAVSSVNGRVGDVVGLAEQSDLAAEATTRGNADTAHAAAADPHPGYLTPAEGAATYDALGAAAAAQAAAVAASQPLDSDLTAIAALSTTAFGRGLLTLADAAAGRSALALGTLATQSGTFSGTSSGTNTGDQSAAAILAALLTVDGAGSGLDADLLDGSSSAAFQPVDSDLTAIAALTTTSYGRALLALADAADARSALALGTAAVANTGDFDAAGAAAAAQAAAIAASQPADATLTALAAANWAANAIPVGTGADTLAQTALAANTFPARSSSGNVAAKPITDFGLSLVDDADATTARTTLGLGTASTAAAGDFVSALGDDVNGLLWVTRELTPLNTGGATPVALIALGQYHDLRDFDEAGMVAQASAIHYGVDGTPAGGAACVTTQDAVVFGSDDDRNEVAAAVGAVIVGDDVMDLGDMPTATVYGTSMTVRGPVERQPGGLIGFMSIVQNYFNGLCSRFPGAGMAIVTLPGIGDGPDFYEEGGEGIRYAATYPIEVGIVVAGAAGSFVDDERVLSRPGYLVGIQVGGWATGWAGDKGEGFEAIRSEIVTAMTVEDYTEGGILVRPPHPDAAGVVPALAVVDASDVPIAGFLSDGQAIVEDSHVVGDGGEPAYANGWDGSLGGAEVATFYRFGGRTYVDFLLTGGDSGDVAFVLPAAYRPPLDYSIDVTASDGVDALRGILFADATGDVSFTYPVGYAIVTGSVSFRHV